MNEPFREIQKKEYSVRGLKSENDAAFLQYRLSLLDSVIRAHVGFGEGKAFVLFSGEEKEIKKILGENAKELKGVKTQYSDLVEKSFSK